MHVLETCLNPTCPIKMTRHCHVFDSYKSGCGRDTTQELFLSSPVRPNFYTTINLQLLLHVSGETYSYILFTNSRENKKKKSSLFSIKRCCCRIKLQKKASQNLPLQQTAHTIYCQDVNCPKSWMR